MHTRRENIDCNYDIHRNLYSNMPTFGSVNSLLRVDLKIHNLEPHVF